MIELHFSYFQGPGKEHITHYTLHKYIQRSSSKLRNNFQQDYSISPKFNVTWEMEAENAAEVLRHSNLLYVIFLHTLFTHFHFSYRDLPFSIIAKGNIRILFSRNFTCVLYGKCEEEFGVSVCKYALHNICLHSRYSIRKICTYYL